MKQNTTRTVDDPICATTNFMNELEWNEMRKKWRTCRRARVQNFDTPTQNFSILLELPFNQNDSISRFWRSFEKYLLVYVHSMWFLAHGAFSHLDTFVHVHILLASAVLLSNERKSWHFLLTRTPSTFHLVFTEPKVCKTSTRCDGRRELRCFRARCISKMEGVKASSSCFRLFARKMLHDNELHTTSNLLTSSSARELISWLVSHRTVWTDAYQKIREQNNGTKKWRIS